ncbi:hypothetical protein LIER_12366 [Lithospermum erythrorhizon]|uniref:Retrotransposon gag domain-containing protein n=1 Tax=Lithospermum erythrorhizon TaxID=34254 RepID=A0AAV3PVW1_LITER
MSYERSPPKEYLQHRDKRHRPDFNCVPSTKRDARGSSSNAELLKQVDEFRLLLRDITPGGGIVKHNTLLPFSNRDDEVYERAFPSSLSGQALKWFHKLPPNSIDCWQDIVDLFMDKYGACIVADEDEKTLMELQRRPRETLRSFATKFEEVATNIPIANKKVTMISFFHGFRYGPLKEKLVLEPPNTRNELSKLLIQYIMLEEVKLLSDEYSPKAEKPKGRDDCRRNHPVKFERDSRSVEVVTPKNKP